MEETKVIRPQSTLIPIGLAAAIFFSLLVGYRNLSAEFQSLKDAVNELRAESRDMKNQIGHVNNNRWTAQDMEIYALRVKMENQNILVPDVSEIVKRRQQMQPK